MKYAPSIAFEEMSGFAKDVTAAKAKGRKYLRNRGYGKKTSTASQSTVKGIFKQLSQSWKNLTVAQIKAWNNLAQSRAGRSILGSSAKISGLNLYQRLNFWIIRCGGNNSTTFKTANSVWVKVGFPVLDNYVDINRRFLQADFSNIDFSSDTAATVINDWCKRSTEGLIERLNTEIDKKWVMLLADALYFKGQWASLFSTDFTVEDDFTDSEGDNQKVDFMKQTTYYRYLKNDSCQIVELPYGNRAYSMYVAIPEQGQTVMDCASSVISNMDGIVKDLRSTLVSLSLPKFETVFSLDANQILSSIGISRIFDASSADFGRETPLNVYVNLIKQQSIIKVTEVGTEAAAVTYAGMYTSTGAEPPTPLVLKVNKPFIYVIRETSTGTILFAGKVNRIE